METTSDENTVSIELHNKCIACLKERGRTNAFREEVLQIYEDLIDEQIAEKLDEKCIAFCEKCKTQLQNFKAFKDLCKKSWNTLAETLSSDWACELEQLLSDSPKIPNKICWNTVGFNENDQIYVVESDSEASTISLIEEQVVDCNKNGQKDISNVLGMEPETLSVNQTHSSVLKEKQSTFLNSNNDSCTTIQASSDFKSQPPTKITQSRRRGSCTVCHKITNSLQDHYLREHTTIAPDGKYVCSFCTRIGNTTKLIIAHIKACHSTYSEPKECSHCSLKFIISGEYLSHVRKHQRETRKHTCNICGKIEDKASRLYSHIMRIHKGSLYCKFCYKPFTDKAELEAHLEMERERRGHKPDFLCDICGFKTKFKQQFNKHLINFHSDSSNLDTFDCFSCDKTFASKQNLSHHMKIVHDKKHQCAQCNKRFGFPKDLRNHIQKKHTKDGMKVACEICGKIVSKQALSMHKQIKHSQVKIFACNVCDKGFKKKSMLNIHYFKHTGFRPYFCYICNRGFYDSPVLQKHFEREHGKIVTHEDIKKECKRKPSTKS